MSDVNVGNDSGQSAYPEKWETHAVLADGATVEIRPIRPSDRAALVDFHARQSSESIYFRFFRHRPELSERELDFFTQVDYRSRMAFVAFESGRLVAVARYEHGSLPDAVAEVAFFVDDANHGRGLATLLLEYLAAAARANGFTAFTATVLPENYRMLSVFRAAGFTTKTRFADGLIDVDIDLTPTSAGRALIEDRLRRAVSRSIAPLLEPTSVAVIGAGHRPGALGHQLFGNLLGLGTGPAFAGAVVAVNPNSAMVRDHPTWPSVAAAAAALPDVDTAGGNGRRDTNDTDGGNDRRDTDADPPPSTIDLAVIAVPADHVASVVEECGEAGVQGVMVVASGFADRGPAGAQRQRELVAIVRKHGMRMIGPNAFGVANTAPTVALNALAVPVVLEPGGVAVASESGVLAAAVIDQFRLAGVGVSQIVGVGNQADVTIGDLIGSWALHEPTRVIVVYSERLTNERVSARALADAARLTSMTKPIVAVRPGDAASAQLLAESGVILVDAVSELADQAAMMSSQPVALGSRVAVVANSGSLARLTAAACRRFDLTPVVPSGVVNSAPSESILIDDLDQVSEVFGLTVAMSRTGTVADYERVIVATGVDEEVDAVILALVPTDDIPLVELERLADRVNRSVDKPFVVVGLYDRSGVETERLPFFTFPEEAARTLARSAAYGRWRTSDVDEAITGYSDQRHVDAVLGADQSRRLSLSNDELPALLVELGLPIAPYARGAVLDELEPAAETIGYPVVLKIDGQSNAVGVGGGTAVDLHDAGDLAAAHKRMTDVWGPAMDRALVQKMVPHSLLARFVLERDPALGPSLSIGFGGTGYHTVQPLDRTFLPSTDQRLDDLVAAYRRRVDSALLTERAVGELRQLADTLADIGSSHAGVERLVLDPVLIGSDGAIPVDVEIELSRVSTDPLDEVRRLE